MGLRHANYVSLKLLFKKEFYKKVRETRNCEESASCRLETQVLCWIVLDRTEGCFKGLGKTIQNETRCCWGPSSQHPLSTQVETDTTNCAKEDRESDAGRTYLEERLVLQLDIHNETSQQHSSYHSRALLKNLKPRTFVHLSNSKSTLEIKASVLCAVMV